MPHQVDGAFVRAPCPVPSCPACEPNSGSVFPSLSTRAHSSRGGPALLCNQVPRVGVRDDVDGYERGADPATRGQFLGR